ncbi:MAG: hypothetical protein HZC55_10250 [Verrucomicrobia bacterium]|nr:hypothetical protein [Verrucomicrobiota bacterium]
MNHREPPTLPVATNWVLRSFSLLRLPALAPKTLHSLPRARPPADVTIRLDRNEPLPYLPVQGAPPLRFERPTPPPDLVTHPAAAAPPIPPLTPTESTVAQANAAAVQPTVSPPVESKPAAPAPAKTDAQQPARPPPSILPDDTRPAVRPEDFLPFFQLPGARRDSGGVNVIAPVNPSSSGSLAVPPSSATYTQTPK